MDEMPTVISHIEEEASSIIPRHPGEILKDINGAYPQKQLAADLQISNTAISALFSKRARLTPLNAVRLAFYFEDYPPYNNPEFWMIAQFRYDQLELETEGKLPEIQPRMAPIYKREEEKSVQLPLK